VPALAAGALRQSPVIGSLKDGLESGPRTVLIFVTQRSAARVNFRPIRSIPYSRQPLVLCGAWRPGARQAVTATCRSAEDPPTISVFGLWHLVAASAVAAGPSEASAAAATAARMMCLVMPG